MASTLQLTLLVRDWPEMLALLRGELATILREEAEAEAMPLVATRLRTIAAAFESGQRPETTDGA